ncbi:conserved hypothetical protein [delta proteobacterium NaphS2]|nr:conserved hypothetical protein [delta proteobacterium NaphS2]
MKIGLKQIDVLKFGVSYFDPLWITVGVNLSLNLKALSSGCVGYQASTLILTEPALLMKTEPLGL